MDKQKLLVKYFNGECSSEEKQYLFYELQHGDVQNYDEILENLWDGFNDFPELKATTSEKIYRKIKIEAQIPEALVPSLPASKPVFFYPVAASLIALCVLTGLSIFFYGRSGFVECQTAYGEKKLILLPDSSVVTLNANSTLKYNRDDFSGLLREVWLTGEAFFDIKKKRIGEKSSQFIVYSDDLRIEVLGTKFNVNSRRETTKVVLESGKVLLSVEDDDPKKLIMKPGDMVAYSKRGKKLELKKVDPKNYSGWKQNTLIHHDGVTVNEIARTIKDNFGYNVIIEDPEIRGKVYKGVFPAENIDVLLQSLSKSFDLAVIKNNNQILLKNNAPAHGDAGN